MEFIIGMTRAKAKDTLKQLLDQIENGGRDFTITLDEDVILNQEDAPAAQLTFTNEGIEEHPEHADAILLTANPT